jgi:hypothetical protein
MKTPFLLHGHGSAEEGPLFFGDMLGIYIPTVGFKPTSISWKHFSMYTG